MTERILVAVAILLAVSISTITMIAFNAGSFNGCEQYDRAYINRHGLTVIEARLSTGGALGHYEASTVPIDGLVELAKEYGLTVILHDGEWDGTNFFYISTPGSDYISQCG